MSRYPTDDDTGAKNIVDVVLYLQRQINTLSSTVTAMPDSIKADILGGAPESVDTLKELADLIENNKSLIESLQTLAGSHVRYDTEQTLTDTQKAQARDNIGAVSATGDVEWSAILNKPSFSAVATSGAYSDLTGTPSIPDSTSDLTNDSGFITGVTWSDVTGKPTFATVATSGSYNDLSNKPTIPTSMAWTAITGKPSTFTPSSHTHTKSEITDFPSLATVATTGSYNDLTNKPTIVDYSSDISSLKSAVAGNVKYSTAQSLTDAQKLQARTNIGVPTTVSSFTNDAGYLTDSQVIKADTLATVASTGSYTDLSNKPTIPTGSGIHYIACSGSTAAVTTSGSYNAAIWRATDSSITELTDGIVLAVRTDVAGNSSYGTVLKINDLDEYPIVYNINSAIGSRYGVNSTVILTFNATQTATVYKSGKSTSYTGCFQVCDYDTTINNQLRHGNGSYTAGAAIYRYQFLFQTGEDTLTPANTNNSTKTTKTLSDFEFDPFGQIVYYSTTTTLSSGSAIGASTIYQQVSADMRYSWNVGTTLTASRSVYLKCSPQTNGKVKFADDPIVQDLPTTDDGYVYILLGQAYSGYQIELYPVHPVYQYKSGKLCLYTAQSSGASTWDDITGKPTFATVATTGSYNDLSNTPTITDYSTDISNLKLAVAGNVKYSTSQSLTDDQKAMARTNIGALADIPDTIDLGEL